MTDEEYVRAHWERVDEGIVTIYIGDWTVQNYVGAFNGWAAAAEFTRERLEQIRQLEEEIDNQRMIFGPDFDRYDLDKWSDHLDGTCEAEMHVHVRIMDFVRTQCSISRTLARLESALADLRRGMK